MFSAGRERLVRRGRDHPWSSTQKKGEDSVAIVAAFMWGMGAVWGEDAEEVICEEADNEVVSQVAWEWLQVEPEILPNDKKEHTLMPAATWLNHQRMTLSLHTI